MITVTVRRSSKEIHMVKCRVAGKGDCYLFFYELHLLYFDQLWENPSYFACVVET